MSSQTTNVSHKSVLMTEVLEYLNMSPNKTYLDVTFGAGGHTRALLEAEPTCKVIAMDWDATTLETYGSSLQEEFGDRFSIIWGNFSNLYKLLKKHDINKLDGILADFGTSQIQIMHTPGISFNQDTPLDMRLSPSHQPVSAADVVNKAPEEKLAQIFFQLGQEAKGRHIAKAIVKARDKRRITTTGQLVEIIATIIPFKGKRSIHPATKVFQALRMYVNHELDNIQAFLPAATQALNKHGRLVCISFHSLEDQMVKQFFKNQYNAGLLKIITPHAVMASEQEKAINPSSRSARLRVAEKL